MSKLVQHHEKYKEIHGEDKVVLMTWSEHQKLHNRLRREGKCNIPPKTLKKIALAAHGRTEKAKETQIEFSKKKKYKDMHQRYDSNNRRNIGFCENITKYISFSENIRYNIITGHVNYYSRFIATYGKKLFEINI